VLALCQRRENVVEMGKGRRCDGDGVEIDAFKHLGARAERMRDIFGACHLLRARRRGQRHDFETRVVPQGRQMHADAETGADDSDLVSFHVVAPIADSKTSIARSSGCSSMTSGGERAIALPSAPDWARMTPRASAFLIAVKVTAPSRSSTPQSIPRPRTSRAWGYAGSPGSRV